MYANALNNGFSAFLLITALLTGCVGFECFLSWTFGFDERSRVPSRTAMICGCIALILGATINTYQKDYYIQTVDTLPIKSFVHVKNLEDPFKIDGVVIVLENESNVLIIPGRFDQKIGRYQVYSINTTFIDNYKSEVEIYRHVPKSFIAGMILDTDTLHASIKLNPKDN